MRSQFNTYVDYDILEAFKKYCKREGYNVSNRIEVLMRLELGGEDYQRPTWIKPAAR